MRAPSMHERPISSDSLRAAAAEIAHAERARTATRESLDALARVVAEVLFDQAEHRAAAASSSTLDARAQSLGSAPIALPSGDALAVLRTGARNDAERALVACLCARHIGAVLERRDGVSSIRAALPSLDWLEFVGQFPPYTAARHALDPEVRARFEDLLRVAPVEAPTELGAAALRALRGGAPTEAVAPSPSTQAAPAPTGRAITVAGELEGAERSLWLRALTVVFSAITGAVRAVLRVVFSLRSPATVSLDGDQLRVVGHTELLGRTLRTYDHRIALASLSEVQRESRFPMLPVAASVCALFIGSTLGAKYMIEGAGGRYWVLVALGLGLIAAGVLFDFVVRAIFPGVQGRTRLTLRAKDRAGIVLTGLDVRELDALLDAIDARGKAPTTQLKPLLSGADALSADTVLQVNPRRGR